MFHGGGLTSRQENIEELSSQYSSQDEDDVSVTSSEIRRQRMMEDDDQANGVFETYENVEGDLTQARSNETFSDLASDTYAAAFQDRSLSLEETRDMILSNQHKTSSSLHGFLKPQLVRDPAEIIVITTSLRGGVKSFFASTRMVHLMNCKRVIWISIDMNKDVIYGRSLKNTELLKYWESENILDLNPAGRVMVPQCLVDGISIGDVVDVAGLEEDGDLDYIINRERCPHCLSDRGLNECYSCGSRFRNLVPEDIASAGGVIYNLGFEEVPFNSKAQDFQPHGNPKIDFTPLEDIKSSITF